QRPKFARHNEGKLLFAPITPGRALVIAAVTRIQHNGLDPVKVRDSLRTELRLKRFRQVHARDEKFSLVFDDGEAKPIARAIDHNFAAIERELERSVYVLETNYPAAQRDAGRETVKLCDVIDAQIIMTADFDDLPIIRGKHRSGSQSNRNGKQREGEQTFRQHNHSCVTVPQRCHGRKWQRSELSLRILLLDES